MVNHNFSSAMPLPDEELAVIFGGVTADANVFTEARYLPIKQRLTNAANADDFETFSSIVCNYASVYGQPFFVRVTADFSKTEFLTASRYAQLLADFVAST